MKKILCGMFYRLFRGLELWALLALMTIASLFAYFGIISDDDFNSVRKSDGVIHTDYYGKDIDITASNVKQYCFESLGISAYDVYRAEVEVIPDSSEAILNGSFNYVDDELYMVFRALGNLFLLPSALMAIFIPVFFGRMFSDGTLKNLISCGHSKGMIYLSSLLVTIMLDTVLFIMNMSAMVFWCAFFEWKPPIYLPVVISMILLMHLLVLTLSSISLSILFASSKKTASFVAGFMLVLYIIVPGTAIAFSILGSSYYSIDTRKEDFNEFREIINTNRQHELEQEFDILEFNYNYYYKGRKLDIYADDGNVPVTKYIIIAMVYADPGMIAHFETVNLGIPDYMMARDGLYAINFASCTFWLTVSTGIGYLVFRKREIHC